MFISVKEVEKEQPTHSLGEPRPHANGRGGAGTERKGERKGKKREELLSELKILKLKILIRSYTGQEDKNSEKVPECYFLPYFLGLSHQGHFARPRTRPQRGCPIRATTAKSL